ncbi:helix-turn-helix domain-containing protein [Streptomyces sp. NPDC090075]|uniref:helix-turn-helix domain-containing protein n=1 Tax=Streptomyces sp. NPDC090075 TaxID=3365937 RepID=UPI003811A1E7
MSAPRRPGPCPVHGAQPQTQVAGSGVSPRPREDAITAREAIMRALYSGCGPLSLAEVVGAAELSVPATRKLLRAMEHQGRVRRNDYGAWSLTGVAS